MTNHKFGLDESFQQILYKIDNWINESSFWVIESKGSQCINVSIYRPLVGSSYLKLPPEQKRSKEMINQH